MPPLRPDFQAKADRVFYVFQGFFTSLPLVYTPWYRRALDNPNPVFIPIKRDVELQTHSNSYRPENRNSASATAHRTAVRP